MILVHKNVIVLDKEYAILTKNTSPLAQDH